MQIRVLVADSQPLTRLSIEGLLSRVPDIRVVGWASSGREAVDQSCTLNPDVVLIETHMPGAGGLEAIRAIRQRCPQANILVLTQDANPDNAVMALEAGAVGYVLKDIDPRNLIKAIHDVAEGRSMLNPWIARYIVERLAALNGEVQLAIPELDKLSNRQREILAALGRGMSDGEIARSLFLSKNTVKTHIKTIYQKLGVRNRAQAATLSALFGTVHKRLG